MTERKTDQAVLNDAVMNTEFDLLNHFHFSMQHTHTKTDRNNI